LSDPNEKLKKEIWQSFVEQQHVHLATVDGDQPRLRPVTLIRLGGKLFVATGAGDAKVRHIERHPKAEFCLLLEKGDQKGTIRAQCTARFVEDKKVKADAYKKIPFMKDFWPSPEDPRYALIELEPSRFEYMRRGSTEALKVSN